MSRADPRPGQAHLTRRSRLVIGGLRRPVSASKECPGLVPRMSDTQPRACSAPLRGPGA